MYHSVQQRFFPPGYGNHNNYFGYWRFPTNEPSRNTINNNNNNNMASISSGSPSDGPPPLIPITQPAEDSQDDETISSPPCLHERVGPCNPMANMSSFVNQHAYTALWQSTSIARLNAAHGVPAQGLLPQQARNPAPTDRTPAPTAEPPRTNVQYRSAAPSFPPNGNSYAFNGYGGNYANHFNNNPPPPHYNNIQQYQQVHPVQAHQRPMMAPTYHHPPRADVPYVYFGSPSQNSHHYHRGNASNETFLPQQGPAMHQPRPAPPVSASMNHHAQPPQALMTCAPPVNAMRQLPQVPQLPPDGEHERSVVASRKRKTSCPETNGNAPVLASAPSEQTIPSSMGATPPMADNSFVNRVNSASRAAAEPVAKSRKVSAHAPQHQNKPVAEDPSTSRAVVPLNTPSIPDKGNSEETPTLRRYRYLIENPFVIQDLILQEKRRIHWNGLNHLEIELDIKPGQTPYQTIDFVRFHRLVAAGRVCVRLSETNMGPVVLVVHPSAVGRLEPFTTAIQDLPNSTVPLVEKLLNPLESTECFRDYALLAHREQLCWELAGLLGSLDEQINNSQLLTVENVASLHSEAETCQTNVCSSSEGTDVDEQSEEPQPDVNVTGAVNDITEGDNEADEIVDREQTAASCSSQPSTKTFSCQICGKAYTLKKCYIRHVRAHEKPKTAKTFQCGFCGKWFAMNSWLQRHINAHHGSNLTQDLRDSLVDQNGNNRACQFCQKIGGCLCLANVAGSSLPINSNEDVDLNAKTRPIQLVTLDKLRNSLNAGKLCVRVSEKYPNTVLIVRPEQEELFASDSVDVRLVEDVGRISSIAAELVNPQTVPEHANRCAVLSYEAQFDCWKLAGCLEPQVSPVSCRSTASSIKETPDPSPPLRSEESSDVTASPIRQGVVDPMSLLECVVGSNSSPEKRSAAGESLASNSPRCPSSSSAGNHTAGPLFTNPLGEQSLEDIVVNHLFSMIPQQTNQQIFDLLNTMDVAPLPSRLQHSGSRGRTCVACNETFADNSSYLRHRLKHEPHIKVHECPQCGYMCLRRDHLTKHVRKVHAPKEPNNQDENLLV